MEPNKTFSTRDIHLATTLVTMNYPLQGIDYQVEGDRERPVGYFNFQETQELLNTEKEYWQGKLLVEPKIFVLNLRGLKAQTNSVYKSPQHF